MKSLPTLVSVLLRVWTSMDVPAVVKFRWKLLVEQLLNNVGLTMRNIAQLSNRRMHKVVAQ